MNKNAANTKLSTRKLVIAGMMVGMSVLLTYTPLGIIPTQPVSATILHIPTIVAAILEGPVVGVLVGIAFGVSTLIRALTSATGPLDPLFINPLISVLPRALIGLTSYYAYKGMLKILPIKGKDAISTIVGSAVGSMTNTVGVLGMLYLLYARDILQMLTEAGMSDTVGAFIMGIVATQGILEMVVACFAAFAVIQALKKAYRL